MQETSGHRPEIKKFSFRGIDFYTKTLSAICIFSGENINFATGWTFDGHVGVCSDLIYAISTAFRLDENEELGFWMEDKFRSPTQRKNIKALEDEIVKSGGNPNCKGSK